MQVTSAAKSALISPIALSPARNVICTWIGVNPVGTKGNALISIRTFEKRLFSIFFAIDNLRASGRVRSSISLCCSHSSVIQLQHLVRNSTLQTDLLYFIINHESKSLPSPYLKNCGQIQSVKQHKVRCKTIAVKMGESSSKWTRPCKECVQSISSVFVY
jgi:hypothetical protein